MNATVSTGTPPAIVVLLSVQVQTPFPVGVTHKMALTKRRRHVSRLRKGFQNKSIYGSFKQDY